jgi:minor extracellular serine protease Vpr
LGFQVYLHIIHNFMATRFSFVILILFYTLCVWGQDNRSVHFLKYSAGLKNFLASDNKDTRFIETINGIIHIPLFIELENENIDIDLLERSGIRIRTVAGSILTADVPYSKLQTLASLSEIKKLELPLLFHRDHDTLMKKFTTVDRVLSGNAPLSKPYTGKGVVIGIIDDGIEFGHPDFIDSAGHTKIHSIWQMDLQGKPPSGFQYGTLWEKDSLDYYLANGYNTGNVYAWQNKFGYSGHGTPVASLAAGRDGVAPGATIVGVALTAYLDTLLRSDRIIDGIAYIYSTAKALNKKCVINISLGTQWGGPHDGKTLVEKAIDHFSFEKPDLIVCSSAGNDGNNWKHWGGFPIHADSSFGFARYALEGSMYFSIPKQYSSTLSISISDTRSPNLNSPVISRDSISFQTPFLKISNLVLSPDPVVYNHFRNGYVSGTISFTASAANEDYDELIVTLKEYSSNQAIFDYHISRFIFKGTGMVHGYFPFFNLHPLYHFGKNPYPDDSTYVSTDNEYTSGIPTNAFTVFSSGAYNLRNCYVNGRLNVIVNGYQPCRLTYFTSKGPTFDGRIKPDIITPGENVLAARSRWNDFMGHHFTIDQNTQMFGGTSASSPITAGIAALVWEKFPWYTRDSVIYRIKSTAYSDTYTSSVPNNLAGWGKADAFKALTDINTDISEACNDFKVCTLFVPPPPPRPTPPPVNAVEVYPNPSTGMLSIKYTSIEPLRVSIYNSVGQLVKATILPTSPQSQIQTVQLHQLAEGIYFLRFTGKEFTSTSTLLMRR